MAFYEFINYIPHDHTAPPVSCGQNGPSHFDIEWPNWYEKTDLFSVSNPT
jgi:hypothetical protein